MGKIKATEILFYNKRLHQFILLLIPLALYIQTYSFDFSYHDDDTIVLNNYQTLHDFNLEKIFFSDAWMLKKQIELYRPWQSFTYAIDNFFSGKNAAGYHLHNVLIFCLCIQLLYLFLLLLKIEERHSFFLTMVFSVHFLFAHTVSWIPARGDLYLFAFSLGCLLSYFIYLKRLKPIYILLSSLFYFLALLSKETAIVLLPLLYLTGIVFWGFERKKIKSYLFLLPAVTLTVIYLIMRSVSISTVQNIFTVKGFIYNMPMLPEAVCKFFVPLFFSVMPAFSITVTVIGLLLMVLISGSIYFFRKTINKKIVITGAAFFLLPILPSLIYKPAFTGFAYDYLDHRLFFPGIGLLLISYAIVFPLLKKNISINYLYGIVTAMFLVAFVNSENYANYKTYYENAIATNPTSGLAHSNYGASLARENKYDEALLHFNKAVELSPKNIEVRMKLADSYLFLKDYKNLIIQCREVIALNPKTTNAYYDLAVRYINLKMKDSAVSIMNKCVLADTLSADAYYFRGLVYKFTSKNDSALTDFIKTTSLNNQYANGYFQQGYIYGNTGKFTDALSVFEKYVTLNPNDGNGYFYRGQSKCMLNNIEDGCKDLHIALNLGVEEARPKINYWCK